jgi:hypothetical protein
MTTIKIGLYIKLIPFTAVWSPFLLLKESNLPKRYKDFSLYAKYILEKQNIMLEVRSIQDILFIEKVEFMELEQRSVEYIFNELLTRPDITSTIKQFRGKVTGENLSPVLTKFRYAVNYEKILIYLIWKDKNDNIFIPQDNIYKILNEGDTYQIN